MHDLLIEDLRQRYGIARLRPQIEDDVRDRLEFGLRKYGKPLRSHNGRNPLLDAYQEILDALVYFIQAMVESQVRSPADAERIARFSVLYQDAVSMAVELRSMLEAGREH
jgi:hypothetical protein